MPDQLAEKTYTEKFEGKREAVGARNRPPGGLSGPLIDQGY